ncbi:uncharacterized protein M6B38_306795 [Iris pallida]|uniref:Uncharacterized protein n=1 Tax=Iris pallida TaxID=29817 RepID=A0AAX6HMP4_IRIPA|nr:uncharacterized protein M6B38_306795 [Iris pallida]
MKSFLETGGSERNRDREGGSVDRKREGMVRWRDQRERGRSEEDESGGEKEELTEGAPVGARPYEHERTRGSMSGLCGSATVVHSPTEKGWVLETRHSRGEAWWLRSEVCCADEVRGRWSRSRRTGLRAGMAGGEVAGVWHGDSAARRHRFQSGGTDTEASCWRGRSTVAEEGSWYDSVMWVDSF